MTQAPPLRSAPVAGSAGARAPGTIENGVLIGEDGMLFLAEGAHRVLEQVTGETPLRDVSLRAFGANLTARGRMADQRGFGYVHLITPDKQSFLSDLWPLRDRPFHRMGERVLERLRDLAGAERLLYPVAELSALGREAAWDTDTHYTDRGAILMAQLLAERLLGASRDPIAADLVAGLTGRATKQGDLGAKLTPPQGSSAPVLDPAAAPWQSLHNGLARGNDGIMEIHLNPRAALPQRLVLFGDSFGRQIAPLLSAWFREVLFLRSRHFHAELVALFRPHHVITQNVERYLNNMSNDGRRAHFLLIPHQTDPDHRPDPDFVSVLADLLAVGRPRYAAFIADRFGPDAEVRT